MARRIFGVGLVTLLSVTLLVSFGFGGSETPEKLKAGFIYVVQLGTTAGLMLIMWDG
jgi:hypothetical protein